jgi:hypothetical protein
MFGLADRVVKVAHLAHRKGEMFLGLVEGKNGDGHVGPFVPPRPLVIYAGRTPEEG